MNTRSKRHIEELLNRNKNCSSHLNFLGAGCAQHFVPAVCDEIAGRAEFLTAYVGESYADHGKWQALFEYASLMGELLDMDVLSCPLFDGAQAAATSLRMAGRATGRREVLLPRSMNPETLMVIRNYLKGAPDPYLRHQAGRLRARHGTARPGRHEVQGLFQHGRGADRESRLSWIPRGRSGEDWAHRP